MSPRSQRICLWSGPVMLLLYGLGFAGLAHLLIPPNPQETPQQIAHWFAANRTGIRLGLVICMAAAGLFVTWSAGLFIQLRRIAGPYSPMPWVVASPRYRVRPELESGLFVPD
jgi:hypothetical protein